MDDPSPLPPEPPADPPRGTRRHTVDVAANDAGRRLDRVLADALPDLSRSRIQALIAEARVRCGGATVAEPSRRVKPGERYAIEVPPAAPARPEGQAIPLTIVYEDAELIVIDKPAGLVVHPAPGNPDRTLVNALIAHMGGRAPDGGAEARPGIVHRLDKDTSGLLVAAKTARAYDGLLDQFARHDLERAYRAVVWGVPAPREGRITGNIGRSPRNRKKMAVVQTGGKHAETAYRVIRPLGGIAALVECRLATGRTHQIRVHLAAIGHPVAGDPVYGGRRARALSGGGGGGGAGAAVRAAVAALGRQALHAGRLGFVHPVTGARLAFDSDLPPDIAALVTAAEADS